MLAGQASPERSKVVEAYRPALDWKADAASGKKVWEVQATDPQKTLSITGAPRIAEGRIFIGEAGSEFEQRGYMAAYDADTGKELWRWWSVPGDPAKHFEQPELEWAAKTWNGLNVALLTS